MLPAHIRYARNPAKRQQKSTLSRVLDLLGGEAGICLIASTELARNATRQPGGDRVRQRCCPRIYDMREIPQNGNKKALFLECLICLAEKQGFEPWLRFTRTTPLAGEPLRPLGYFSTAEICDKRFCQPAYNTIRRGRCQ